MRRATDRHGVGSTHEREPVATDDFIGRNRKLLKWRKRLQPGAHRRPAADRRLMRWEPDRIRGEHARDRVPVGSPHGGRVLLDGRADRGKDVFSQRHGFDIISDTTH